MTIGLFSGRDLLGRIHRHLAARPHLAVPRTIEFDYGAATISLLRYSRSAPHTVLIDWVASLGTIERVTLHAPLYDRPGAEHGVRVVAKLGRRSPSPTVIVWDRIPLPLENPMAPGEANRDLTVAGWSALVVKLETGSAEVDLVATPGWSS